jgi:hypothetical protein
MILGNNKKSNYKRCRSNWEQFLGETAAFVAKISPNGGNLVSFFLSLPRFLPRSSHLNFPHSLSAATRNTKLPRAGNVRIDVDKIDAQCVDVDRLNRNVAVPRNLNKSSREAQPVAFDSRAQGPRVY